MLTLDSQMGEDEGGRSEQVHAGNCCVSCMAVLAAGGASSKGNSSENKRKTGTGRAEGRGIWILGVYRDGLSGAAGLATHWQLSTLAVRKAYPEERTDAAPRPGGWKPLHVTDLLPFQGLYWDKLHAGAEWEGLSQDNVSEDVVSLILALFGGNYETFGT